MIKEGIRVKREKKFDRIDIAIYVLIFLSILLFWIPFMGRDYPAGAEIPFHYARIGTLADSLKEGIFPAKLRPMHMKLYGYGVGFFYPDIFIYPAAILIVLGVRPALAIKIFEFVYIVAGALIGYTCYRRLTGNRLAALFGEVLFIGSRINFDNFVGGSGLPHLNAYLFAPLAIVGLLEALEDKKRGYIDYAIGITLVILSHHLIFMTLMFSLFLIVIAHIDVVVKNVRILGKLFAVSLVAMAFTTAYWLPAMEQAIHIKFIAVYDNSYNLADHIMGFYRLFTNDVGIILYVLFIISAAAYAVFCIKKKKADRPVVTIFIIDVLMMYITCSRTIWLGPVGQALSFFQYTERFVYVLTNLMIIFIVMVIGKLTLPVIEKKREYVIASLFISAFFILLTRFDNKADFYDLSSYPQRVLNPQDYMEEYEVSGAEWLPVECEPSACTEPNYSRASDGAGADGFKHENAKYYEVWADLSKEYYYVPYVYYYGYRAYLVDDDLKPTEELKVGEAYDDNGYVRVFMPEGRSDFGHLLVTYKKTTVQKTAYVISAVTAVLLVAALALEICRKRKGTR